MAPPEDSDLERPKPVIFSQLTAWGSSSLPPMGLATLITSLHYRPFQPLPMLFVPLLVFTSYLSLAGFKIDGAGMGAAFGGMYTLLAARRRPTSISNKFTLRGAVRGMAMGLGVVNCVAGGYTYAMGDRKKEDQERREMDRWGAYSGKE